jgi:beta-N-acetylhexosaminidase
MHSIEHGISPRKISDDPARVCKGAEIISQVYANNSFMNCGKHYPGGHDAPYDTHMREGISTVSEEELIKTDLAPYLELAEKGLLPCIMTGHTVYPAVDPEYPASLSKKVIDLIRDRGYDGLIFTDSFAMMGILQKYGEENVYGMALAAGNDIVLPNFRHSSRECFQMLVQNYKDGLFSEQRLNEAVRRVLAAQDFISDPPPTPPWCSPRKIGRPSTASQRTASPPSPTGARTSRFLPRRAMSDCSLS